METNNEKTCPFWKMHGAGNDFILFDNRTLQLPVQNTAWLKAICDRHRGIGSEGIILIEPSEDTDFFMRFFNPDGSEAAMCGNGARCAARLAHDLNIAPAEMTFMTRAGNVRAVLSNETVMVSLPAPHDLRRKVDLKSLNCCVDFINTGVPHVVVFTQDLTQQDIHSTGRAIRQHPAFAPNGTNVNFAEVVNGKSLIVRTYERGVEAETPACGTGITASALIAHLRHALPSPIQIVTSQKEKLTVAFKSQGKACPSEIKLTGPACYSFTGSIKILCR